MSESMLSIEAAVRHEFACYYLADELPDSMDDAWLDSVTPDSAERMTARVGAAHRDMLVAELRAAAGDRVDELPCT
jgi:hypothetical protein